MNNIFPYVWGFVAGCTVCFPRVLCPWYGRPKVGGGWLFVVLFNLLIFYNLLRRSVTLTRSNADAPQGCFPRMMESKVGFTVARPLSLNSTHRLGLFLLLMALLLDSLPVNTLDIDSICFCWRRPMLRDTWWIWCGTLGRDWSLPFERLSKQTKMRWVETHRSGGFFSRDIRSG